MLYSDKVLDHFSNPRNVGEIPDADGVGEVGNAKCGDIMKMYLKINGGIIEDVKFKMCIRDRSCTLPTKLCSLSLPSTRPSVRRVP